ncbi:uncharacterized protein [Venturia canescens]|uniref:uncharacterized protein isoform X2 n=1 Tax=Venturia canescens TaxID=32260 RepID=UPI001C9CA66A|nr:uncharacterized protein LOC122408720 isoform X2 [Venturia canescens]
MRTNRDKRREENISGTSQKERTGIEEGNTIDNQTNNKNKITGKTNNVTFTQTPRTPEVPPTSITSSTPTPEGNRGETFATDNQLNVSEPEISHISNVCLNLNSQRTQAQWNCRGLRGKTHEMPELVRNKDILILAETWLHPNTPFKIPGFHLVRKDRPIGEIGGGVAIGIKNDITLVSHNLAPACCWKVLDDNLGSDHLVIDCRQKYV